MLYCPNCQRRFANDLFRCPYCHADLHMETQMPMELNPGWKVGPLPPGTYNWGAIVTVDMAASYPADNYQGGMLTADFCGDHVRVGSMAEYDRYEPDQIAYYNNSLMLPKKT